MLTLSFAEAPRWNNKAHSDILLLDCALLLRVFGTWEDEISEIKIEILF